MFYYNKLLIFKVEKMSNCFKLFIEPNKPRTNNIEFINGLQLQPVNMWGDL